MKESAFYKSAISDELAQRCERNPRYSMRAFAHSLGLESGPLSEILNGKRVPSYKMAERITSALSLTPAHRAKFLLSIAETQESRGLKRMSPLLRRLKKEPPLALNQQEIGADLFRVIGEWYHYAILEMTFIRGFKSSPQWIARELGISAVEAKLAIERLTSLGLLNQETGTLKKAVGHMLTADRHLTTPALKKRQKQILGKAIDSLENHPIEKRNMSAMTMAIDPRKIPKAKVMIDEFLNTLCSFLESGEQSEVYEFGTFLIPLQRIQEEKRK